MSVLTSFLLPLLSSVTAADEVRARRFVLVELGHVNRDYSLCGVAGLWIGRTRGSRWRRNIVQNKISIPWRMLCERRSLWLQL